MRFKNTSPYPDAEVRRLLKVALKGVRTTGIAINIKTAHKHTSCGGWAYRSVPSISTFRGQGQRYLITITIAGPKRFKPYNNLTSTVRWRKVSEAEAEKPENKGRVRWTTRVTADGVKTHSAALRSVVEHPYGGVRSPLIEVADWREALVKVVAHEGRHVVQYRRGKPASEVDAEKWAAKRLEEYRRSHG